MVAVWVDPGDLPLSQLSERSAHIVDVSIEPLDMPHLAQNVERPIKEEIDYCNDTYQHDDLTPIYVRHRPSM
jgi:hypothetical protein